MKGNEKALYPNQTANLVGSSGSVKTDKPPKQAKRGDESQKEILGLLWRQDVQKVRIPGNSGLIQTFHDADIRLDRVIMR